MSLLKTGEVSVMISTKEVDFYLAKKFNVKVKILVKAALGTPVTIAVKKALNSNAASPPINIYPPSENADLEQARRLEQVDKN